MATVPPTMMDTPQTSAHVVEEMVADSVARAYAEHFVLDRIMDDAVELHGLSSQERADAILVPNLFNVGDGAWEELPDDDSIVARFWRAGENALRAEVVMQEAATAPAMVPPPATDSDTFDDDDDENDFEFPPTI